MRFHYVPSSSVSTLNLNCCGSLVIGVESFPLWIARHKFKSNLNHLDPDPHRARLAVVAMRLLRAVQRKVRLIKELVPLVVLYIMILLAKLFPSLRKRFEDGLVERESKGLTPSMEEMLTETVSLREFAETFYSSFGSANQIVRARFRQNACCVFPNEPIEDVPLIRLHDGEQVQLSQLLHPTRPLVVNFGSCT